MLSLYPPTSVGFLFATDAILARWNLSHPHIAYGLTAALFIAPLFTQALGSRLLGAPNHHLEVEAILTYLATTLAYLLFFSSSQVQQALQVIYGVVIVHLVLTPPEETLLHRLLFITSLCLHVQHMASIAREWSGKFERQARLAQRGITFASFFALTLSVAVDIWAGQPMWIHFALLAALPYVIPLDKNMHGELIVAPLAHFKFPKAALVLGDTGGLVTSEGKPCDESGLLINY
jgi:hypothetical protein